MLCRAFLACEPSLRILLYFATSLFPCKDAHATAVPNCSCKLVIFLLTCFCEVIPTKKGHRPRTRTTHTPSPFFHTTHQGHVRSHIFRPISPAQQLLTAHWCRLWLSRDCVMLNRDDEWATSQKTAEKARRVTCRLDLLPQDGCSACFFS